MKTLHASIAITAAALTTALLTAAALSGPLDPPAGPVAPTYKTLSDIEPRTPISAATTPGDADSVFRIAQPGSYYLTGNLTGVTAKSVIEIAADDVTLDLNGFAITGVIGSLSGVISSGARDHIVIRNGGVRAFPVAGVSLSGANNGRLESLVVTDCGDGIVGGASCIIDTCTAESCDDDGITAGVDSIIRGCISRGNGGEGIVNLAENATMLDCTAAFNGGNGIRTSTNGHVQGCRANRNTGSGILVTSRASVLSCSAEFNGTDGIQTSITCLVADCNASDNDDDGIQTSNSCTVRGCNLVGNGDNGLEASAYTTIAGCTAVGNGANAAALNRHGFRTSSDAAITACTASNNGTNGISAGTNSVISQCIAGSNDDDGVVTANRSLVERCNASGNTGDGIEVAADCRVLSNACVSNGLSTAVAAGIHATSSDNRIDDNTCTDNDTGFLIDTAGNILTRNTASGNGSGNYSLLTSGNACLVVNAITTGAFTGSSGGTAPGSTDPSVNFSY